MRRTSPYTCKKTILRTRCDNPAERGTEDFDSYFEYLEEINETELYGACQACIPCINLSAKHLQEMERTLLKYFGKQPIAKQYPAIWDRISTHFEAVAKNLWLDSCGSGRSAFARACFDQIALFIPADSLLSVENALDADEDLWNKIDNSNRKLNI